MIKLNGQTVNITLFPDNTSQVWKLPEEVFTSNRPVIDWTFSSEADIMHILQLQHLLQTRNSNNHTTLNIKYLPYGRQDKAVSNDATFGLQTFLVVMNQFRFHKITVLDPHNWDAVRFNSQIEAIYPTKQLLDAILETQADALCYPDKGAVKKYTAIQELPYVNFPYLYGEKVRDQSTGNITHYELFGNPDGKNILIVDDICDGGATFKILAKSLLDKGAKSVALFVTHGIFSKGVRTLFDSGIARIFTADGEVGKRYNAQNI